MKHKHKLIEGPLGIRCSDKQATELQAALKDVPQTPEYKPRRLAFKTTLDLQPGERADVSLITSAATDLEQEKVLPQGLRLDIFAYNPIVLWCHYSDQPCGRSAWLKHTPQGILAKTVYPECPTDYTGDWLPDKVYALVKAGLASGKSIGFIPTSVRGPTIEEKELEEFKGCEIVIDQGILYEFSVCTVPCNPDALVQIVKSADTTDLLGIRRMGNVKTARRQRQMSDAVRAFADAASAVHFDSGRILSDALALVRDRGRL